MKPKPFSFENHLTVPSANRSSFYTNKRRPWPEPSTLLESGGSVASAPRKRKEPTAVTSGPHRAPEQHRNRHRPDPSRDGSDEACSLRRSLVDIPGQAVVRAVHTHVAHRRARQYVVGPDHACLADRDDENVRLADVRREVACPRMANGHSRVRVQEEQRSRLADDVAAPDDDCPRPLDRDLVLLEQRHHS